MDFEEYLPLRDSLDFKMPVVKAYSYRSKLYHEKMIENITLTTLNKMAYNYEGEMKEDKSQRRLKVNSNVSEEEIVKKLEKRKNCTFL